MQTDAPIGVFVLVLSICRAEAMSAHLDSNVVGQIRKCIGPLLQLARYVEFPVVRHDPTTQSMSYQRGHVEVQASLRVRAAKAPKTQVHI